MRVLIVEDDPDVAVLIVQYLGTIAESIVVAPNMQAALAEIEAVEPFDLVTLDLSLPDSAPEQTKKKIAHIKSINPHCLLVVITGMPGETEAAAVEAGADGFMFKPASVIKQDTFLTNLRDIARSIAKIPDRYTKNIVLLEELAHKVLTRSSTVKLTA